MSTTRICCGLWVRFDRPLSAALLVVVVFVSTWKSIATPRAFVRWRWPWASRFLSHDRPSSTTASSSLIESLGLTERSPIERRSQREGECAVNWPSPFFTDRTREGPRSAVYCFGPKREVIQMARCLFVDGPLGGERVDVGDDPPPYWRVPVEASAYSHLPAYVPGESYGFRSDPIGVYRAVRVGNAAGRRWTEYRYQGVRR